MKKPLEPGIILYQFTIIATESCKHSFFPLTLKDWFSLEDSIRNSGTISVVLQTRLLRQFQVSLVFFLRKIFKRTKTQIKQKSTNKTKISEQKTTGATIFRLHKKV